MRNALHIAVVGLAVILSAACGTSSNAIGAGSPLGSSATPGGAGSQSSIGPTWQLVSINGGAALADVKVTATFTDESRVSGSGGCNAYTGAATVNGEQLKVGPTASTRMYCGGAGVMEQEEAYFSALGKATVYRVVGSELQLGPAQGAVSLVFTRQ